MRRRLWSLQRQADFVSKLGELLQHGYTLAHAVYFLMHQSTRKQQQEMNKALDLLKKGHPLHFVLTQLNFHPVLVSYIYYGEHYGDIARSLKEGGQYWKKRTEDFSKIKKLFTYPIFLFFIVSSVFIILQNMLLPRFTELFSTMDVQSNLFLYFVLLAADFLPIAPIILLFILLLFLFLKQYWFSRKLTPLEQKKWLLKTPIFGSFLRLYDTHFFCSQFSGLLSGGLSVNASIKLFAQNQQQPFYQSLCKWMEMELLEGKPLHELFEQTSYFERNMAIVVADGQKYGRLDQELHHYSQFLLEQMEERIHTFMRIIQPLLFSLIGLLIISIYLAVLLPMFSLLEGF